MICKLIRVNRSDDSLQIFFIIYRSGTGIGTVVMAPLFEYILDSYGIKRLILVTAAFSLGCCIFGFLMRPFLTIKSIKKGTTAEERQRLKDSDRSLSSSSLGMFRINIYKKNLYFCFIAQKGRYMFVQMLSIYRF